MGLIRIFVASSSEGEKIAKKLRGILQKELENTALVEMWRSKFTFGETAIESLETVANEADFALLVMTPDDITVSRKEETAAPRDNLVFELGLFIGSLGRERAIIARDTKKELKLPSDALSITVFTYDSSSEEQLNISLQSNGVRLAEYIKKTGVRPKWLAQGKAAALANEHFCHEIEGYWYEKIDFPKGTSLSFFSIARDPVTSGLLLDGTGYDIKGNLESRWKSEMVRIYPMENRLAYLWKGKNPLPGRANLNFHGYGTMDFHQPDRNQNRSIRGSGDFWVVNEASPDGTVFKPMALKRVVDDNHITVMKSGTSKEKSELVLTVTKDW